MEQQSNEYQCQWTTKQWIPVREDDNTYSSFCVFSFSWLLLLLLQPLPQIHSPRFHLPHPLRAKNIVNLVNREISFLFINLKHLSHQINFFILMPKMINKRLNARLFFLFLKLNYLMFIHLTSSLVNDKNFTFCQLGSEFLNLLLKFSQQGIFRIFINLGIVLYVLCTVCIPKNNYLQAWW